MATSVSTTALNLAAALLISLGALGFAWSWLWLGLLFLLLSTPVEGVCDRLASLRLQDGEGPSWWSYILPALSGAALFAVAYTLSATRGWGCVALAVGIIAFQAARFLEVEGREISGRIWLAERKGMAWLLLPFAATGLWGTGLGILAFYACASFFWAQRQIHKPREAPVTP